MTKEKDLKRLMELKSGSIKAFSEEIGLAYTTVRSILERGVFNAKVENVKNIIADTWENLNVLEKQEFINLSVKNIYVTYVRGKRGRTPNSINIDDITFY